MIEPIQSQTYHDHTIHLHYDLDPPNPRLDYDHLTTFYYDSDRYQLGDISMDPQSLLLQLGLPPGILDLPTPQSRLHTRRWLEARSRDTFALIPYYAHIHSAIILSLSPFSCSFDSGQCGFIHVPYDHLNGFPVTPQEAYQIAQSDLLEYSAYLSGHIYGYTVEPSHDPNFLQSCWGFTTVEDAITNAQSFIDSIQGEPS